MHMKFAKEMHQFITFQATSSSIGCFLSFPPNKVENLTCYMSKASIMSAHKGGRQG